MILGFRCRFIYTYIYIYKYVHVSIYLSIHMCVYIYIVRKNERGPPSESDPEFEPDPVLYGTGVGLGVLGFGCRGIFVSEDIYKSMYMIHVP